MLQLRNLVLLWLSLAVDYLAVAHLAVNSFEEGRSVTQQPALFSTAELRGSYTVNLPESLPMSAATLQAWKQRVFQHQQAVAAAPPIAQGSLFDSVPLLDSIVDSIDPWTLPQQNTEFWRWQAADCGVSALYFVVDQEVPLLLYVGETLRSQQRWKGEHDCKRYLLNYIAAHRPHALPVAVNIGFWANAPLKTRDRQQLESALIRKWRSPFNKENWDSWNTPFVGR